MSPENQGVFQLLKGVTFRRILTRYWQRTHGCSPSIRKISHPFRPVLRHHTASFCPRPRLIILPVPFHLPKPFESNVSHRPIQHGYVNRFIMSVQAETFHVIPKAIAPLPFEFRRIVNVVRGAAHPEAIGKSRDVTGLFDILSPPVHRGRGPPLLLYTGGWIEKKLVDAVAAAVVLGCPKHESIAPIRLPTSLRSLTMGQ